MAAGRMWVPAAAATGRTDVLRYEHMEGKDFAVLDGGTVKRLPFDLGTWKGGRLTGTTDDHGRGE